jgi:hypothetical protein
MENNKINQMFILFVVIVFLYGSNSYAKNINKSCDNTFTAYTTPQGYTWTLTSRMLQILRVAEQHYGKRDKKWTLAGVEFSTEKQPKIWYPYSQQNEKFIIIQLTPKARCNLRESLFQLSHEVIHLLSPAGGDKQTTVLEEGLASYFSINYLKQQGYTVSPQFIADNNYQTAYQAIAALYAAYPNTGQLIKKLRQQFSTFKQITPQKLQQSFPNIPSTMIKKLLSPF